METGLLHLHNILRWIILLLLLVSIVKSYSAWKSKKAFTAGDKKLWLFTMVAMHITLLIGLFQVTLGRYGMFVAKLPEGTSLMEDKFFRFYWVEHPTAMLLATILITVGRGMSKKPVADEVKYRKAFWLFLIALILILAGIPWPFREIIGRPLIPGM
jgi:Ca2+/Na+ antiporter